MLEHGHGLNSHNPSVYLGHVVDVALTYGVSAHELLQDFPDYNAMQPYRSKSYNVAEAFDTKKVTSRAVVTCILVIVSLHALLPVLLSTVLTRNFGFAEESLPRLDLFGEYREALWGLDARWLLLVRGGLHLVIEPGFAEIIEFETKGPLKGINVLQDWYVVPFFRAVGAVAEFFSWPFRRAAGFGRTAGKKGK